MYNPDRDLRSVQYHDPSQEPQWVDPRQMVRVEDKGQLHPMMPQGSPHFSNHQASHPAKLRPSRSDPRVMEQLQSRIEIARLNCEFYEQLLQSKNDCSIQAGKKIAILDSLIQEHHKLLQETRTNTERAEKVAKAVIHMLKQAEANDGTFPPTLQQKAGLVSQAVSHLKGLPSTTNVNQLQQKLSQHDQAIAHHFQQLNKTTQMYQQKIHEREAAFVQLQQKQERKSSGSLDLTPSGLEPSPTPTRREKKPMLKQEPLDELDELDELDLSGGEKEEQDIWSVFEAEDNRRNAESAGKIAEAEETSAASTNKNQKSEGVIFLTDEEAAAYDKHRSDQKAKKETNISQFWDDLGQENEIQEVSDDDEDIMGPSARSSGKSSKTTISISFGGKAGRKKSSSAQKKRRPMNSTTATSVLLNLKPASGLIGKKYTPISPSVPGKFPFPSTDHEALRIVVHSCSLKPNQQFLNPDPYCSITLGSLKRKTAPLSRTSDNVWHETFLFSDKDLKKARSGDLVLSVCHYKKNDLVKLVTTADVIARTNVNLTTLPFSASADMMELPLYSRATDKKVGDLFITIHRFNNKNISVEPIMTEKKQWGVRACSQYESNEKLLNLLEQSEPSNLSIEHQKDETELQRAANQYPTLDLDQIQKLLRSATSIPYNWVNCRGQNFLHLMILQEDLEMVAALAKFCNLFQRDFRGCTPLDSAIHIGNFEIVQILVNTNFNIINMADDTFNVTPLMLVAMYGRIDMLTFFLDNGASVNDIDRVGGTALMKAAMYGHIDCVSTLCQAKAIVGLEDAEGFSALLLALLFDHEETAKFLLDFGASFTTSSEDGESPFFVALMRNAFSAVKTMMMYDVVLEEQCGRHKQSIFHRMMIFCEEDNILKFFQMFADSCTNVDFALKNRMSQSALYYAAHFNYVRVMKFLLDHGCDAFLPDRNLNRILHYCSSGEAVELVIKYMKLSGSEALVQENINQANKQGNTPLHIAYAFGNKNQIQVLVQHGGDLSAKNKFGNIPHHMILADRRRLLPLYTNDEETPKCGCIHIGPVHVVVDQIITF